MYSTHTYSNFANTELLSQWLVHPLFTLISIKNIILQLQHRLYLSIFKSLTNVNPYSAPSLENVIIFQKMLSFSGKCYHITCEECECQI